MLDYTGKSLKKNLVKKLENPNAFAIKHVLLPGVAIGMALTLFGTYIQRMSDKAEEKQVLADLVKKLMA